MKRITTGQPEGEVRGWYLYKLLEILQAEKVWPLEIVETGCFCAEEGASREGNGWSTWYLAKFAKEQNAKFISIELIESTARNARERLDQEGLCSNTEFVINDARVALSQRTASIDFAYLDTMDGEINLTELLLVIPLLQRPALVVIDDCYDTPELAHVPLNGYNKGQLASELATVLGIPQYQLGRFLVLEFE